jgi:predicted PurR-regulated permease PerM
MLVAGTCTGMMAGICYHFIGLPYPVVLGLLTGLMNFIPFVGPWIAGVIVALVGLFVSPLAALLAIIATIVPQSITDNFITPRVMAHAVELHPSVILIVLFAGGALGGILGMICAIPVTAAAKSIFVYYFEKRTGRQLISLKGALFKGKPPTSPDDAPADDPDAADAPTSTPAPPASPDDDPAVPTSLPAPTDPI